MNPRHFAQYTDGILLTMRVDKRVPHLAFCAKYAAAFLARMVTMIEEPTESTLILDGKPVVPQEWAALRESVQIVFQHPNGSLNPRQRGGAILEEPLKINRKDMSVEDRTAKAREMLGLVGLRPEHFDRYPHMFSGGQRQHIAIARALMLGPKVLVLV